jgi:hypothetical protein
MTSWVVWAAAVAVAGLTGLTATHFSVRTLRYVTAGTVIAILTAVTAYGQTPPGSRAPGDLAGAFELGANRLSAAFFKPLWALWSSGHAPAPGRLGWAVIAVVLVLGYRQSEKWAMGRQAPQLDTGKLAGGQPSIAGDGAARLAPAGARAWPDGPTAGQRHEWLAAEVRFRLAAVDVYAPPILPGGTRSDGLASIAEASGVGGAGLAGAIIRFAGALWPAPRRYELRVWVEGVTQRPAGRPGGARTALTQAAALARTAKSVTVQAGTDRAVTVRAGTTRDGDDDARAALATRVTVELDEPGAGRTIASKTIVAETIDEAASMVAGYVARQVFSRDPVSPSWCYGASDGRDLGALLLARQERVYVLSADDVRASRARQIAALWSVTGADRCAGVVRYELASLEDLEREQLIALRLHAMNREQYPRFLRGTYRLCMSLEMVADPSYSFLNPAAARVMLDDTLDILYRAGLTAVDRCGDQDIHPREGSSGPSVLSRRLREELLESARRDLRALRNQLLFPVIAWNTFWRRDERTVWQPHWRLSSRQGFRDGVCVAELLVAVKHRVNERNLTRPPAPGTPPGPAGTRDRDRRRRARRAASLAERFWRRKGLHIVAAITGDASTVHRVLTSPPDAWPSPGPAGRGRWVPPTRDRVRWLSWQARTTSWQAAYNTACLYAVLVREGLADEEQVVASLRRVVLNRESGVERPHDWISNDPDFAPLLADDSPYRKVRAFLEAQERRDYPLRQVHHVTGEDRRATDAW